MLEFPLSSEAQHWINVVLIWIGFGSVAGLLATVLFPLRRPTGPFGAIVAGLAGSAVGLFGLSRLYSGREWNPISPLGFLAAVLGAFVLLVLFRVGSSLWNRQDKDQIS